MARTSATLLILSMTATHDSKNFFLEGPAGKLEAVLWTPHREIKPRFAAVVCHPHPLFGGTLHNKVVYQAAKALDAKHGAVLRFNFRSAGLSEGKHDRGQGEQGDVAAALEFLAGEFPELPLVLAGFSFGCWVGLRVGCKDARVKRLIGIGAPVNSSDFSYLDSCAKPKLFVHGEKDEFGDVSKLREFVATLPGEKNLVVVEGVDHFFKGKVEEFGDAVGNWMEGWPAGR
ncbi:MAG: Dot/Icm type IV secretion system effector CoxH3 [Candidatus Acidiferrum sp.]